MLPKLEFPHYQKIFWIYQKMADFDILVLTYLHAIAFIINTWSNRQIWPWNTEWSRAKTNRVLPRKLTGHSKHPLPTTQEDSTHGQHQMVNTKIRLIIFFAVKDGEALQLFYTQQKQDRELTVAQIMNSLLPNSDLNWRK